MALDEKKLMQTYQILQKVFPEDLHIARPLIQMLQHNHESVAARNLAMSMARRMLASGKSAYALSFLTLCQQLNHPDVEEIEALSDMARYSFSATDTDNGSGARFALIDQLSDSEALDFIRQGNLVRAAADDEIVQQGESSKTFYLILNGEVDVQINLENGERVTVSSLAAGDFFGEFACVYHLRRSASVVTNQTTLLLEFSDQAVAGLMHSSDMAGDYLIRTVQTRMVHAMTHSLPAFSELPEDDRLWAAEESCVSEYNNGELISGSFPHSCQVLLSGQAVLDMPGREKQSLSSGAMFSDLSPHLKLPGDAHVRATEHTLVCHLPENIFHSFMNVYASFEQHVKQAGSFSGH